MTSLYTVFIATRLRDIVGQPLIAEPVREESTATRTARTSGEFIQASFNVYAQVMSSLAQPALRRRPGHP